MKKISISVVAICIGSWLTGCTKTPDVPAGPPPKSVNYYVEHFKEAETVIASCNAYINGDLSVKPEAERKKFYSTPQGINCRNATEGYPIGYVQDRVKRSNATPLLY